jgi:hypothetical protein
MTSKSWFPVLVGGICLLTFGCGVGFTFIRGMKELSVALVVGSIFALASFLGQVWTFQVQAERELGDRLWGADERRHLRQLGREYDQLVDQLDAIDEPAAIGGEHS